MGEEFEAYTYLGAHVDKAGVWFRTFAPLAKSVSVIGDFNNWIPQKMQHVYNNDFWQIHIDSANPGQMYKFQIEQEDGQIVEHADPYGFYSQLRPESASIIRDLHDYTMQDADWKPDTTRMNIYEIHFGSWKKPGTKEDDWYTYEELGPILVPYVKEMGYNFIEIMPLNEYPCDQSWGYQATGFFSPTSRYGTPSQLAKFVECCHQNGVGVLLDFVPVHFAINEYGLRNYDGSDLYSFDHDVKYNEWGSCNFNHARREICSFLQSSAYYWLHEFHFDGLRMDAIGNLIFWQGNHERGENKEAIQFLQVMNAGLKKLKPECILIAEDSSSWLGVTHPVEEGGLGFDYKWDLGWMNDTLKYFSMDPFARGKHYHMLTWSMAYFYNENYLLPFSHDEVVHGKKTIVDKMFGSYEEKFAQARALYMYMYAHPGKKLNFMGNELGQLREWDERRGQDWDILKYPIHSSFCRLIHDLNECYTKHPAFYELDGELAGFSWIDCHLEDKNVYVMKRMNEEEAIMAVFNFSGNEQVYACPSGVGTKLTLLLDSDGCWYGGHSKNPVMEMNIQNGYNLVIPAFTARFYQLND